MRGKLTKRAVDALKPSRTGDRYLWDTEVPGFACRVKPSGAKAFFLQYYAPGFHQVKRRYTIARYGPSTVDEARREALDVLARVRRGEDVAKQHTNDRRRAKEETVARLMIDYLEYGRAHWKASTVETFEYDSELHIVPRLGRLPVHKVATRDIADMHLAMKGKPTTANRCVRAFKAFWYWCERRGIVTGVNPAKNVELYREQKRQRFLTVEEMGRLGHALRIAETVGLPPAPQHAKHRYKTKKVRARNAGMFKSELRPANPIAVAALRFLIVTGWRESEALTLKWSYLDLAAGRATLPDTKSGESVRALGATALGILKSQDEVKDNPYVFPGNITKKPVVEIQRLWYAARHHADLGDVRLHDLRHSVASVAGGHNYSMFLIGKLLGHRDSRSTERYAHLGDDARKAVADSVGETIRSALDADPLPRIA